MVKDIYDVLLDTEEMLFQKFDDYKKILPKDITFVSTFELEEMYPDSSFEEREKLFAKEKGAIFISKIGRNLKCEVKVYKQI